MGADRAEKGNGKMMKIFVGVALGIVCTLELGFAIWDYNERKRKRR